MSMKHAGHLPKTGSQKVLFTLPKPLTVELKQYADLLRNGNKSGFVADAIRVYIDLFHKSRHTQLLRESYSQASEAGQAINSEWELLDNEAWAKVDQLKKHSIRKL